MSWSLQELELEHLALWPAGAKLLLLALVCGLLCLSGGYFFIAEHWLLWQQGRQPEAELKLTFKQKAKLAASLAGYQQQVRRQEHQLVTAMALLPPQRHGAQLLGDLSVLTQRNSLHLTGFKWQAERPLAQATELPLQLTLVGDYHQLGRFVAQVSVMSRLVIIDGFELRRSPIKPANNKDERNDELKKHNEPLNMSLSATAYVYQDSEGEADQNGNGSK